MRPEILALGFVYVPMQLEFRHREFLSGIRIRTERKHYLFETRRPGGVRKGVWETVGKLPARDFDSEAARALVERCIRERHTGTLDVSRSNRRYHTPGNS